jgi:hypothetical protein
VHLVAVAHPDRRLLRQPADERILRCHLQLGATVLARFRRFDLSAQDLRADLHAVTDAEHRHTEVKNLRITAWRVGLIHAARPARKDQPLRLHRLQFIDGNIRPNENAVDALLAHPPRDQLGVLRAKIQDGNAIVVDHWELIRQQPGDVKRTRSMPVTSAICYEAFSRQRNSRYADAAI